MDESRLDLWNELFWEYAGQEFPLTATEDEQAWARGRPQPLEVRFPEDFDG